VGVGSISSGVGTSIVTIGGTDSCGFLAHPVITSPKISKNRFFELKVLDCFIAIIITYVNID
jgi:hypothetical protein